MPSEFTLLQGDANELIPGCVVSRAAVVTDPPYGINYRSNHNSSRRGKAARWVRHENFSGILGDDKPIDPQPLLDLGVPTIIFGGNYIADRLPPSRCWIVWNKRDGIAPNNQADCEMAWTNLDKPSRIFDHLWSGWLRAGDENISKAHKQHPHQKPVQLMARCIDYLPERPAVVIDPYMGSGSTGVACAALGIDFIGIELDRDYFTVAQERVGAAYAQGRLAV